MAEDDGDWTDDLPLGDDGPQQSRGRQLALIAGIVVLSIAVILGLVLAGAALLRVVTDRANHTSPSFEYGQHLVTGPDGIGPQRGGDDAVREICTLTVQAAPDPPADLDVDDAVAGCIDAAQ